MIDDKKLYWIWADMKSRCKNPKHKAYKNYGGRGIMVCESWESFSNFAKDMMPRLDGYMLDRIDNSGNYSPENCKWATRKEQNSNRRNCIYVSHNGEQVTLKEYCRRNDLTYRAIVKRIQDRGWPLSAALTLPLGSRI
jgi:hypothetical protein